MYKVVKNFMYKSKSYNFNDTISLSLEEANKLEKLNLIEIRW